MAELSFDSDKCYFLCLLNDIAVSFDHIAGFIIQDILPQLPPPP